MSDSPISKTRLSLDEFHALLEQRGHDRFIELIDGEVVEKMPNDEHGYLVIELAFLLKSYFRQAGFGRVVSEVRVEVEDNGQPQSRLPDLSVYLDHLRPVQTSGRLQVIPDIAIEVQSPGDSRGSLIDKIEFYLANGSREGWIVYPRRQTIETISADHIQLYSVGQTLESPDLLPGFQLDISVFFTYPRE